MKRNVDIVVGIVGGTLLLMFLFGILTSLTIPFSNTPVPFQTAVGSLRHLSDSTPLGNIFGSLLFLNFLYVLVAVALLIAFLHCSRMKVRVAIGIVACLLPMLLMDPTRVIAQFLILPFIAPSTTIGMFAGTLDGEDWAEGFVALAAASWWSILWLVACIVELRRFRMI